MKKDITSREDIKNLVDSFYDKVRKNEVLGYIFNDIAKVNWKEHLPVMYDFWSSMLLGDRSYQGNPMSKHVDLAKITPLTEKEFSEWLKLFTLTVDDLFEGQKADEAQSRARSIAGLIQHKIQSADS